VSGPSCAFEKLFRVDIVGDARAKLIMCIEHSWPPSLNGPGVNLTHFLVTIVYGRGVFKIEYTRSPEMGP
jgi:hypothetical protein